jgi:hypothetical protein
VVEQHPVSNLDFIPQKIAGLKVAYTIPMLSGLWAGLQVPEGETARF